MEASVLLPVEHRQFWALSAALAQRLILAGSRIDQDHLVSPLGGLCFGWLHYNSQVKHYMFQLMGREKITCGELLQKAGHS